ncbi:phosphotransferase enzyme family protein [Paenibacillus tarimensis]
MSFDNTKTIAMEALTHYSMTWKSITLIGQSANTIYKVTDHENMSYSLRLHLSRSENFEDIWNKREVIQSEMVWLNALGADTDIVLPAPIKNKNGAYLTEANHVKCTLVQWVEGEQKPFVPTDVDAGYVGTLIGKMHKQSSSWQAPDSFIRPSFDGSRISQALDKIKKLSDAGELDKDHSMKLLEAGQRVITIMNSIPKTLGNWGMIHADLIPSNFLFHKHEARPIDFGACGFGFYLFDLGWTFSYIHPAFRNRLLESYSQYYTLPENYIELLEAFFVAGQLETMNFWLGLPDFCDWLPKHIEKLAGREIMFYLNDQRFLFGGTPYWE